MSDPVTPGVDECRLASEHLGDGVYQNDFAVPDMHCGGCMRKIEQALGELESVESARVNLTSRRVRVRWLDSFGPQPVLDALRGLGFDVSLPAERQSDEPDQRRQYFLALAVAGFAASNVMLLSVSVWSGADGATRQLFHWVSAFIAVPAVLYSGRTFYHSAWKALRVGKTNMDVPITVGIALTCCLGIYDTLMHNDAVYFEAAIMLVFFLLIGRTLDYLMRARAASAVDGLQALEPAGAHVVSDNSETRFVKTAELVPGQIVCVEPGQRVPVDGVVESGMSEMDSAIVDGESEPQALSTGHKVLAGCKIIGPAVRIKVSATASDSYLARMQHMVQFAQSNKGPYQNIADKAASLYAPVVHLAALVAFVYWFSTGAGTGEDVHRAVTIAVSVLIITCPCALALAVPMVQVMAGQRLFANGIVMKNGAALEKLAVVDTVVFDKTGTLTTGTASVNDNSRFDTHSLSIATLLAKQSGHPYARAIAALGTEQLHQWQFNCDAVQLKEVPGCGVEAMHEGANYRLGKRRWALANPSNDASADSPGPETVLSRDGELIATFSFHDQQRQDAAVAVEQLQQVHHLDISVLSGDKEPPVAAMAESLGIRQWLSAASPREKMGQVQAHVAAGCKVLMVGDGVNDSGAMAAASVSMAPGNAASIGRNLADFVFVRSSLAAVPDAIAVAKKSRVLVRQNFAIALVYNLLALPFAFAGFVTPLIAAIAMSASSILVVANAMRIRQRAEQPIPVPQTTKVASDKAPGLATS